MMSIRKFLLQLNLCRGIGQVSKVRLWQAARQHHCFTDLKALAQWAQLGPSSQEALLNNWASDQPRRWSITSVFLILRLWMMTTRTSCGRLTAHP